MEGLILAVLVVLVLLNVPIAWSLCLTAIIFVLVQGTTPLTTVPLTVFAGSSGFPAPASSGSARVRPGAPSVGLPPPRPAGPGGGGGRVARRRRPPAPGPAPA